MQSFVVNNTFAFTMKCEFILLDKETKYNSLKIEVDSNLLISKVMQRTHGDYWHFIFVSRIWWNTCIKNPIWKMFTKIYWCLIWNYIVWKRSTRIRTRRAKFKIKIQARGQAFINQGSMTKIRIPTWTQTQTQYVLIVLQSSWIARHKSQKWVPLVHHFLWWLIA